MSNKPYNSSLFKRIIDLGVVKEAEVDDLVRIWRVGTGDEKAITLANFVGTVDRDLGDGDSLLTEIVEALEERVAALEEDLENYVPYTGATGNVDLGENGITTEWVKLNTTPVIPTDQGSLYWDEDDNVLAVVLNGAIQKVGEVTFYNVKNQTGSTIPKGTGVGFAGVVGSSGRIKVAPFLANGSQPSIYYVGITAEAILDGEDGKVYNFGPIRGLNTSAFSEGDVLYASSTVAGGFTTTPPTTPNNVIVVAAVLTDSATVGALLVRITPADLGHPPVTIGTPANGLSINSSTQVLNIGLASASANGALSSTDWSTFNSKEPAITIGTTLQYWRGDKTFQDFATAVRASLLTGYVVGTNTALAATDSVLGAFEKLQGQVNARVSGSGSTNTLPRFTGSATLGNSQIIDTGTHVLINTTLPVLNFGRELTVSNTSGGAPEAFVIVQGNRTSGVANVGGYVFYNSANQIASIAGAMDANVNTGRLRFYTASAGIVAEKLAIFGNGNVLIQNGGTFTDAGFRLDVNGTARIQGALTTNLTAGRVPFIGTGGVLSDSGDLAWNTLLLRITSKNGYVIRSISDNLEGGFFIPINSFDNEIRTARGTGSFIQLLASGQINFGYQASTVSWSFLNNGILQSNGTKTIQTSTGNLTLATAAGNGNILLIPHGTGLTLIGPSTTPTNTLDVNGTARIRTIANGTGNILTTSATGVIQQRTAAEIATDIGAVTITGAQTITGVKTFNADTIFGNTSLDYMTWDNTTNKTLLIFSQTQFLHKYRGGAAGALNIGQFNVGGDASINNTSNAKLLFGTNSTTRIEIEASGNVLLKTVALGSSTDHIALIDNSTGQIKKRSFLFVAEYLGLKRYIFPQIGTSDVNPNVTTLGTYGFRSPTGSTFQFGDLGYTYKMTMTGKVKTRNFVGGVSTIFVSNAAVVLSVTAVGVNLGTGDFYWNVTATSTPFDNSNYYWTAYIEFTIYDTNGTVVFKRVTGRTTGAVFATWAIRDIGIDFTFTESNAANELSLSHGVFERFDKNNP